MSERYDDRYLPATTHQQEITTHKQWKLTKSQYIFYYWLVAHSCWSNNERHYYIYDNKWTQTGAAKDCGITTKTIQRAIPVLESQGIIKRADNAPAYQIYWPHDCAAPINKELLLCFIGLGQMVDLPLFIKLYTLLVYGYSNRIANRTFTIIDLERALHMDTGMIEHIKILTMLGLWEHMHLLKLNQETVQVGERKPYVLYTIENICTDLDDIKKYFPDEKIDIKKAWLEASAHIETNNILIEG